MAGGGPLLLTHLADLPLARCFRRRPGRKLVRVPVGFANSSGSSPTATWLGSALLLS
jgi:hypothetical protein